MRIAEALNTGAWMKPQECALLYALIANYRPQRVLEIGTFKGGSACIISLALEDIANDGHIATLDPDNIDHEVGNLRYVKGASPTDVHKAANDGRLDFVLIDGTHTTEAVVDDTEAVMPRLNKGAMLLYHDVTAVEVNEGINLLLVSHLSLTDSGLLTTKTDSQDWGGFRMLRFCP